MSFAAAAVIVLVLTAMVLDALYVIHRPPTPKESPREESLEHRRHRRP